MKTTTTRYQLTDDGWAGNDTGVVTAEELAELAIVFGDSAREYQGAPLVPAYYRIDSAGTVWGGTPDNEVKIGYRMPDEGED